MRIGIVNEYFYPDNAGGTGTVLSELARTLQDQHPGLEIDVITSRYLYRSSDRKLRPFENWHGISIYRPASPRPSRTSILRRLIANTLFSGAALLKLLRLDRYDLLLIGTAPPTAAITAGILKRFRGTPYTYVIYDLEPDRVVAMRMLGSKSLLTRTLRHFQHHWLHSAENIVVLGRCMQKHLIDRYRVPADRIAVIPVGADAEAVQPMSKHSRFRARYGLSGFIALYAGNFGRYHNFDTILDAAGALKQQRDDITFVLVGEGAQKDHIAQRIEAEGLCNVRLFPFVPQEEYADLLASADISLVTLEEGMEGICVPSKFYSILASARPTIALMSPECEVAYVIQEARCGLRLDPGDSEGLIRTLVRLAESPEELAGMGNNARQILVDHYTVQHASDAYYRAIMLTAARLKVTLEPAGIDSLGTPKEEDSVGRTEAGMELRANLPNETAQRFYVDSL